MQLTRRKFLGLSAIVAATYTNQEYTTAQEHLILPSFQDAKQDKSVREEYVSNMDNRIKRAYLLGLVFLEKNQIDLGTHIAVQNVKVGDLGKEKKYYVGIHTTAFDTPVLETEDDFLSVLIDHEIDGHVKSIHQGYQEFKEDDFLNHDGRYITKLLKACIELSAFEYQLKNPKKRNISQANRINSYLQCYGYYSELIHPGYNEHVANLHRLEKLREDFFMDFFLKLNLTNEKESTPMIGPDGKFQSIYGPIKLPETIIKKYNIK